MTPDRLFPAEDGDTGNTVRQQAKWLTQQGYSIKDGTAYLIEWCANNLAKPWTNHEIERQMSAQWLRVHKRPLLFIKQNAKCANPFCKHSDRQHKLNQLQVDHIIPVTKGGTHEDDNLQLLRRSCNASKGNRPKPKLVNTQ